MNVFNELMLKQLKGFYRLVGLTMLMIFSSVTFADSVITPPDVTVGDTLKEVSDLYTYESVSSRSISCVMNGLNGSGATAKVTVYGSISSNGTPSIRVSDENYIFGFVDSGWVEGSRYSHHTFEDTADNSITVRREVDVLLTPVGMYVSSRNVRGHNTDVMLPSNNAGGTIGLGVCNAYF